MHLFIQSVSTKCLLWQIYIEPKSLLYDELYCTSERTNEIAIYIKVSFTRDSITTEVIQDSRQVFTGRVWVFAYCFSFLRSQRTFHVTKIEIKR